MDSACCTELIGLSSFQEMLLKKCSSCCAVRSATLKKKPFEAAANPKPQMNVNLATCIVTALDGNEMTEPEQG
jgi:hypothetical protein